MLEVLDTLLPVKVAVLGALLPTLKSHSVGSAPSYDERSAWRTLSYVESRSARRTPSYGESRSAQSTPLIYSFDDSRSAQSTPPYGESQIVRSMHSLIH